MINDSTFDCLILRSGSKKNFHALADHYADEIQRHNPTGPYLLGGYCSGALLAHEIAKRLLNNGRKVPLLLVVDQYLPYSCPQNIAFFPFAGNHFIVSPWVG